MAKNPWLDQLNYMLLSSYTFRVLCNAVGIVFFIILITKYLKLQTPDIVNINDDILYSLISAYITFYIFHFFILKKINLVQKEILIEAAFFVSSSTILVIHILNLLSSRKLFDYTLLSSILFTLSLTSAFYIVKAKPALTNRQNFKPHQFAIFLILLCLAGFLLFRGIGSTDFKNDEFPTVSSAWNYTNTNSYYKWDWLEDKSSEYTPMSEYDEWAHYTRAEIHTILLAQIYKFFGISETSSRTPSALAILILLILVFFASKKFFSAEVALLCVFFLLLNPYILEYGRYARMYALLIPFTFLFAYFTHKAITETPNRYSDISIRWLLVVTSAIISLLITFKLHDLALLIIPPTALFALYYYYKNNKTIFWFLLSIGGIAGILTLMLYPALTKISGAFSFLRISDRIYPLNSDYLSYIFSYPIGPFGIAIASASAVHAFSIRNNSNYAYIYFVFCIITTTTAFIFVIDRFAHPTYIVAYLPFVLLIITYSIHTTLTAVKNRTWRIILWSLIFTSTLLGMLKSIPSLYGTENYYYANYTDGYVPLITLFNSNTDTLYIQYERFYYLQELPQNGTVVKIFGKKNYSKEEEQRLLSSLKNDNAWFTWEKSTMGDIRNSTRQFIEKNCVDYSVPNTNVFVFLCKKQIASSENKLQ